MQQELKEAGIRAPRKGIHVKHMPTKAARGAHALPTRIERRDLLYTFISGTFFKRDNSNGVWIPTSLKRDDPLCLRLSDGGILVQLRAREGAIRPDEDKVGYGTQSVPSPCPFDCINNLGPSIVVSGDQSTCEASCISVCRSRACLQTLARFFT